MSFLHDLRVAIAKAIHPAVTEPSQGGITNAREARQVATSFRDAMSTRGQWSPDTKDKILSESARLACCIEEMECGAIFTISKVDARWGLTTFYQNEEAKQVLVLTLSQAMKAFALEG